MFSFTWDPGNNTVLVSNVAAAMLKLFTMPARRVPVHLPVSVVSRPFARGYTRRFFRLSRSASAGTFAVQPRQQPFRVRCRLPDRTPCHAQRENVFAANINARLPHQFPASAPPCVPWLRPSSPGRFTTNSSRPCARHSRIRGLFPSGNGQTGAAPVPLQMAKAVVDLLENHPYR